MYIIKRSHDVHIAASRTELFFMYTASTIDDINRRLTAKKYKVYSTTNQRMFGIVSPDNGAKERVVDSPITPGSGGSVRKNIFIRMWEAEMYTMKNSLK